MPYYVRFMGKEDVAQVTEIDREAFATQLPVPDYEQELKNRLAHYIVAYEGEKTEAKPEVETSSKEGGLPSRWRRLFLPRGSSSSSEHQSQEHILGFAGFWVIADEAHITSIAVREADRRGGIGELLIISTIELAKELRAHFVTLEVRVSNTPAQKLYTKYGFTTTSVRHGYYTDNREDAFVMSTGDITLARYQTHLKELKETHAKKWGIPNHQIIP